MSKDDGVVHWKFILADGSHIVLSLTKLCIVHVILQLLGSIGQREAIY